MNKLIIIASIVGLALAAILIGVGIFLYLHNATGGPTPPNTTPSTSNGGTGGSSTGGTGGSVVVPSESGGTSDGQTVAAKDFLHASDTYADPNNEGRYFLAGTGGANISVPYRILYVKADQSFTIALLAEPIGSARLAAEQALEKTLGISQEDMCTLRYAVLVPHEVNQFYSGKDLRFSFCPGAEAL
jgi:hypothetical protein